VGDTGHVPSNIATLVQQKFLQGSAGKEKRKEAAEHDNIDLEQGKDNEVDATALQDNVGAEHDEHGDKMIHTTPATPVKRFFW
jgi:hypothetical protein